MQKTVVAMSSGSRFSLVIISLLMIVAMGFVGGCSGEGENQNGAVPLPNGDDGASCTDGIQNGAETDVDCGGGECERCNQNRSCETGSDCLSRFCDRNVCVDELCRGRDCLAGESCYRGQCFPGCRTQDDCGGDGERCEGGVCVPLDCEGVSCGEEETCYLGGCYQACEAVRDCRGQADAQCLEGACISPSCTDGIQNGEETDVDCGGSDCSPCGSGGRCLQSGDCLQEAGEWSSCEFAQGDVCADEGMQAREVSSLECVNNVCTGETSQETRSCSRETDGIECGEVSEGSWGPCEADPSSTAMCSTTGIQTREVLVDQCQSGTCQGVTEEESRSCTFDPTGEPCAAGLSCASGGVCNVEGLCEYQNINPGSCVIDGACYSQGETHPEYSCVQCLADAYPDRWSYIFCTDTYTSTDCGGGAVSCELPGNWEYHVYQLGGTENVPFEDSTGITISTQSFSSCDSILDVYVEILVGGFAGKGELEVSLLPPWGGSYTMVERGDFIGPQSFEMSYPLPNHTDVGETFVGRNGEGVWGVNFNNTGERFALENLIVEELLVEVWCE